MKNGGNKIHSLFNLMLKLNDNVINILIKT